MARKRALIKGGKVYDPEKFPAAMEAKQKAQERDERAKAAGLNYGKKWSPPLRYARSYKPGDKPGQPTGPEIRHALPNRAERRANNQQFVRAQRQYHRGQRRRGR